MRQWIGLCKDRLILKSKLAQRHLGEESLVLYDVSSSYYQGSPCALAAYGHNRDKKKGKKPIVYGLMIDDEGRPLSIQVYPGFTGDPDTADAQINKLKIPFGVERFVLAGDRGMLTAGRIDKLKELGGIGWVSALSAPSIKRLAEQGNRQLSLFDQRALLEISSPDYPGEWLVVCRNPYLAEDRARTRRELEAATEEKLAGIAKRVAAGRLKPAAQIGEGLG